MARLPDDVVKSLVRGVGAFMRKTPANELPRSLRALRNFREKALVDRSDKVLGALEDETLRARMMDWLGDKPPLAKADSKALEIAVRREDGWEKTLVSSAKPKPTTKRTTASVDGLRAKAQEFKDRAAAAQAELRKVRQEARTEAARLRRERDEAAQESRALSSEIKRLRGEAAKAQRSVKAAEAKAERERRRVRAEADKADAKQEALRAKVRQLKEESAELRRRIPRVEPQKKKTPTPGRKRTTKPASRSQLPVPKGLPEDARETLKAWLTNTELTLVIDGYNVTKHEKGFGDLSLEEQRDRLISELQRLSARFPKASIVCVFDGNEVLPGTARRKRGRVKIEYSRPDEIADDHIVALVEGLPPRPVVVVTSDRELQRRVKRSAATVATSPQLLEVTRRA